MVEVALIVFFVLLAPAIVLLVRGVAAATLGMVFDVEPRDALRGAMSDAARLSVSRWRTNNLSPVMRKVGSLMNHLMNHLMTCILPLILSVPLVVLLAGGMTALATRLEGTKNSATLYDTTANDMSRSASEDARVHGTARIGDVT